MHKGTCPIGQWRAVPKCMKLRISRRGLEVAAITLLSVLIAKAQVVPQATQPRSRPGQLIASRISPAPLGSGSNLESGPADSAAVLSSSAVLPLTPQPLIKVTRTSSEAGPSAREMHVWKGLLVAEHSAALFDAWTTRQSLQSGNGYERNPLLKSFADSAAIYPMLQIAPIGLDFLSHRMLHSQNRFIRKTWWVPQLASTGASLWCGVRNLRVANFQR